MKLGIVILNYKTYNDVFKCVESIKNTIEDLNYKIYIVDNNSPNESVEKLTEKYAFDKDVDLIESKINGGFSAGNNIGFKVAINDDCDLILCTNSDVKFYKNSIQTMMEALISQEDVAVVGPKVYLPDGKIQQCNRGILTPMTFLFGRKGFNLFDIFKLRRKYTYRDYSYETRLYPLGMVSGCCFLIKSKILQAIDYLDENVFLYHEEDILGAKLRKINMKVCLEPKAEIIHYGGQSTGGISPLTRYCTFYSGFYYLCKYSNSSKFSIKFVMGVLKIVLFLYSLKNKEYKEYYRKFKDDVKKLKIILKNR